IELGVSSGEPIDTFLEALMCSGSMFTFAIDCNSIPFRVKHRRRDVLECGKFSLVCPAKCLYRLKGVVVKERMHGHNHVEFRRQSQTYHIDNEKHADKGNNVGREPKIEPFEYPYDLEEGDRRASFREVKRWVARRGMPFEHNRLEFFDQSLLDKGESNLKCLFVLRTLVIAKLG